MSENKYPIQRWDAVILGTSIYPSPIIYIKPDNPLVEFAKANNNALLVEILETNSIYDGKFISGVMYNAEDFPNCRQNSFKDSDVYIISLIAEWHSYPPMTGSCKIYGLKGGSDVNMDINTGTISSNLDPNVQQFKLSEPYTSDKYNENKKGMNTIAIVGVTAGIAVILISIILIAYFVNKNGYNNFSRY